MPSSKKGFPSCITVLYAMTISGIMANFMMRVNISIALVGMMKLSEFSTWGSLEKNQLLAIFFWGYAFSGLIGGRMSEKYGPRIIFGYSTLMASLVTIFFPLFCSVHFYMAMVSRFLEGVCLGICFPGILTLAVNWIPPMDRSKFTSNITAQSLGIAITLPLGGYLISYLGWKYVFYVTGSIGVLWCILWFTLIYDSPDNHPRISNEEKNRIKQEMKLQNSKAEKNPSKVPWKSILTSVPFWAIMAAQNGNIFYHFIYLNQLPTYMNDVLKFNITNNGILSTLPFLGSYAISCIGCYLADKLRKSGKISTKNIRRLVTVISQLIPTCLLLVLAFYRFEPLLAVGLLTITHSLRGCVPASYIANIMDIAPNYSGTILGIVVFIGSLIGWLGNYMVGYLTKEGSNFETWQTIFSIIAAVNVTGSALFMIFLSGDVQKWNYVEKDEASEIEPLKIINKN